MNNRQKKRRDIELAIALNHANKDNAENGGGTSNPVESAIKGKEEGGKPETKKPTAQYIGFYNGGSSGTRTQDQ